MKVLWLDDDAPSRQMVLGDVLVIPATSCRKAIDILAREDNLPQWVIVDLIVPQGGWGDICFELPGIEFLKYVRELYPEIQLAVYSVAITEKVRIIVGRTGVRHMFSKTTTSLLGVLHELRQVDIVHKPVNLGAEVPLKDRLQAVLSDHIAMHFSSVRPISREALREIYSAILVLEEDEEKRMRAFQTLEALRGDEAAEMYGPGLFLDELLELKRLLAAMVEEKRVRGEYDVFICYNSSDHEEVEEIGEKLLGSGILPWFDRWEIRPGERWRGVLEGVVEKIRTAAVFMGKQGMGPWQNIEIDSLLEQLASRRSPIIPVILPGAPPTPAVPPFLRGAQWVDFRGDKRAALNALIWGITGWRIKV